MSKTINYFINNIMTPRILSEILIVLLMSNILVSCISTQTRNNSEYGTNTESLTVNETGNDWMVLDLVLVIRRPVESVFAYLIDPDTIPEWQTDIDKQVKITDGPLRVGTVLLNSKKSWLDQYQYEREIINFVPLKVVSYYSHDKPLEFIIRYELEPVNEHTKISINGRFRKTPTSRYKYLPRWILAYGIKKIFLRHHYLLKSKIEEK